MKIVEGCNELYNNLFMKTFRISLTDSYFYHSRKKINFNGSIMRQAKRVVGILYSQTSFGNGADFSLRSGQS